MTEIMEEVETCERPNTEIKIKLPSGIRGVITDPATKYMIGKIK